jgi:hypothetical protein
MASEFYFRHRLFAAFFAISDRFLAVIPAARALPPIRPRATAAAFLPSSVVMSSISPVAILAIMTALPMASAGRFSPLGPRGINSSLALLDGKHIGFCRNRRVYLTVKMVAEYLEHALNFERMAAEETNPEVKAAFESQAAAYRKLAAERTKKLGLEPDSGSAR